MITKAFRILKQIWDFICIIHSIIGKQTTSIAVAAEAAAAAACSKVFD